MSAGVALYSFVLWTPLVVDVQEFLRVQSHLRAFHSGPDVVLPSGTQWQSNEPVETCPSSQRRRIHGKHTEGTDQRNLLSEQRGEVVQELPGGFAGRIFEGAQHQERGIGVGLDCRVRGGEERGGDCKDPEADADVGGSLRQLPSAPRSFP